MAYPLTCRWTTIFSYRNRSSRCVQRTGCERASALNTYFGQRNVDGQLKWYVLYFHQRILRNETFAYFLRGGSSNYSSDALSLLAGRWSWHNDGSLLQLFHGFLSVWIVEIILNYKGFRSQSTIRINYNSSAELTNFPVSQSQSADRIPRFPVCCVQYAGIFWVTVQFLSDGQSSLGWTKGHGFA